MKPSSFIGVTKLTGRHTQQTVIHIPTPRGLPISYAGTVWIIYTYSSIFITIFLARFSGQRVKIISDRCPMELGMEMKGLALFQLYIGIRMKATTVWRSSNTPNLYLAGIRF